MAEFGVSKKCWNNSASTQNPCKTQWVCWKVENSAIYIKEVINNKSNSSIFILYTYVHCCCRCLSGKETGLPISQQRWRWPRCVLLTLQGQSEQMSPGTEGHVSVKAPTLIAHCWRWAMLSMLLLTTRWLLWHLPCFYSQLFALFFPMPVLLLSAVHVKFCVFLFLLCS